MKLTDSPDLVIPGKINSMSFREMSRRITLFCPGALGRIPCLANVFLALLLLATLLPAATAEAQETSHTYTFPECEHVEEELLLSELNRITRSILEREKSGLDLAKIVEENWTDLGLDEVVDAAVDRAVDRVREEKGTLDRIFSGWSENKATEMAESVASQAFGSRKFRNAIDELSSAIVDDLTDEIHLMTEKSASSALLCVQDFIGATFSEVMSSVLEDSILEWLQNIESGDIEREDDFVDLGDRKLSIAGIGTIVGTQIAHLVAKKVAQGILGKVVTRILGKAASAAVPVAGWVIGGALIVFDLYEAWEGSLPQIRDDLKSEMVKETIRKEIVLVVDQELDNSMPGISQSVTIEIYRRWKSFLQDFELIMRLAETNASFRKIVDGVTADQVDKLTELVELAVDVLGKEWLNRIIGTGEFERIFALPRASFEILREKSDPELVLAWAEIADVRIVSVVETGLYKIASPANVGDRGTLERILALEDVLVIQDLMQKSLDDRETLLRLPTMQTKWVLGELSKPEIDWLVSYLSEMPTTAQSRLVDFMVRDRGLISLLRETEGLRSKFVAVLNLAGEYARVESILNVTTAEQVEKLSSLVEVASEVLESEQLGTMIDSGQFEEVFALPQISLDILRAAGNPASVLGWARLAGEGIGQVVETGLYLVAPPSEFRGREDLERVLALGHPIAIQQIMNLEQTGRDALLNLPSHESREILLSGFSEEVLSWMAAYLLDLPASTQQLFAKYVVTRPELIPILRNSKELAGKFPRVLNLALTVLNLREFLENTSAKDIEKLTELVLEAEDSLDSDQVTGFFESGQFEQIFSLPQPAFEILRFSGDPGLVISWAELAGPSIVQVSDTGLYKDASPDHFKNRDELNKALNLHDPEALKWVLQLKAGDRSYLLSFLTVAEVLWLDEFRSGLPDEKTIQVARFIDQNPALVEELEIEKIGRSVKESQNIEYSLVFVSERIEEPRTLWPTVPMLMATKAVFSGNVPFALFGHFYLAQSLILLTALLAIVALALLLWWLNRRRQLPEFWNHLRRSSGGRT